ncbi:MAG: peptide deformylase [Parcubacteria group bacterium GW2011_GWA2_38_13b]|nr:MAG: peptide deformylase [Parcubacteria group bacterium GW2011_GWA2_38_13b]
MPEEKILKIETGAENPILRKKCENIRKITPGIKKLIREMVKISLKKGIGLAANQIGKSLRLFVVTLPIGKEYYINTFINPEIIKTAREQIIDKEGCLSLPNFTAGIKRFNDLTLKYLDENERDKNLEASGLLARVIQHEMDHLNGILICDKQI